MVARLRSWWHQIKRHSYTTGIVTLLVLLLILFIFSAYRFGWDWTGFNNGTSQIIITSTSKVNYTATVSQPSKSLWDWLGLLGVLAIPVVAGIGAAWFTVQLGKASDMRNSLEQKKNQEILVNQFQQAALQSYLDRMSELLLDKKLHLSTEDNEVRKVARARTLATLLSLDGVHKGNLLQFLSESGLIEKNRSVIDLRHADLTSTNLHGAVLRSIDLVETNLCQADLSMAYLRKADLSGSNLSHAILYGADLGEANLSGANLNGADLEAITLFEANLSGANLELAFLAEANLSGANLERANLRDAVVESEELWVETLRSLKGATMPDGSIHP